MYPVNPTPLEIKEFDDSWYDKDYFVSKDGTGNFPKHHCKMTYVASEPFIEGKRNAIDIGCRDGEYTRYLTRDFKHTFCFDYRWRRLFEINVDTSKVTHFQCGLGEENKRELVSGGGSMTSGKIPKEKWYPEQLYTLDEFNFVNVDYIKIDVDGYEEKVLQGAVNTIMKYKPVIVLEAENGDRRAIEYLLVLGYDIVAWDADRRNVIMRK